MIEKRRNYPAYEQPDKKLSSKKALVSLTYDEILEIANVFYYINAVRVPKIFGGIGFSEDLRALHLKIHNSVVNAALSLEEFSRIEKDGTNE